MASLVCWLDGIYNHHGNKQRCPLQTSLAMSVRDYLDKISWHGKAYSKYRQYSMNRSHRLNKKEEVSGALLFAFWLWLQCDQLPATVIASHWASYPSFYDKIPQCKEFIVPSCSPSLKGSYRNRRLRQQIIFHPQVKSRKHWTQACPCQLTSPFCTVLELLLKEWFCP